jgi:hypothetical protein
VQNYLLTLPLCLAARLRGKNASEPWRGASNFLWDMFAVVSRGDVEVFEDGGRYLEKLGVRAPPASEASLLCLHWLALGVRGLAGSSAEGSATTPPPAIGT